MVREKEERTYGTVGEEVDEGQLRGEDGIAKGKLRKIGADRGRVPVHLALSDKLANRRRRERLCQRGNRHQCLLNKKEDAE